MEEIRPLIAEYTRWADLLSDQNELDRLHWSEKLGRYADYGLHTDFVKLQVPDTPPGGQHTANKVAISRGRIRFYVVSALCISVRIGIKSLIYI
ncbi:unnamed protein product [Trichobilharzia regenti]|nr:unnamed protein product [Trichobilharzia regenti]